VIDNVKKQGEGSSAEDARIEAPKAEKSPPLRGSGMSSAGRVCLSHNLFCFSFQNSACWLFSCTNSTVLFAIKYRGRYVIILYSWRLTVKDMKTSRFHKSCKVIAIHSVTRVLLLFFNYRAFIFQTVERPCQAHHTSIGYVLARSGT